MSDGTTCRVTFKDGGRCERPKEYSAHGGICRHCYIWSGNHGKADPNGRPRRKVPQKPCPVVFSDNVPCPRQARPMSGYCEPCTAWSRQNDGAAPNGRVRGGSDGKTCIVVEDGAVCGAFRKAHNMCAMHYARWQDHGDPLVTVQRAAGELMREVHAAASATTDECIFMYDGAGQRPQVELNGVGMNASRAVWIVANDDPGELHVLHTCHRGMEGCINIRHLYLGTHERNVQDTVDAERTARGEKNGCAKLKREEVRAIRKLAAEGNPYRVIAGRFDVSVSTVSLIVRREVWGWLPD